MVNELRERDNLIPVDHSNLLQHILNKLLEKICLKYRAIAKIFRGRGNY